MSDSVVLSPDENGFSATLKAENLATWDAAITHRFVDELLDGSIDDAVMAGYLVQDHRFLDGFLALLGAAIATADTLDARLRFAQFAGEVAGGENTYFLRSFEALGVTDDDRESIPDTTATAGFKAIFREAADSLDYAAALAVLIVTEWLYSEWALRASGPRPSNFVHAEWIDLHDGPEFEGFVAFLRAELDRVGPAAPDRARELFARTVALELEFFEETYAGAERQ